MVSESAKINPDNIFSRKSIVTMAHPKSDTIVFELYVSHIKSWFDSEIAGQLDPGSLDIKVRDLEPSPVTGGHRVVLSGKNKSLVFSYIKEGPNWVIDRVGKTP